MCPAFRLVQVARSTCDRAKAEGRTSTKTFGRRSVLEDQGRDGTISFITLELGGEITPRFVSNRCPALWMAAQIESPIGVIRPSRNQHCTVAIQFESNGSKHRITRYASARFD